MPRLKLYKFSQTASHLLDVLLADPRAYRAPGKLDTQPAGGQQDKRPVLCPELDTVQSEGQQEKDMSTLTKGRKDLGVMLKRVYTRLSDAGGIKPEEAVRIRESVGQLCMVSHTQMIPEEDAINEEMSNAFGIERRR